MARGIIRQAVALLVVGIILTVVTGASPAELSRDQVARSVVFLHVPSTRQSDGKTLEIGTAFLVVIKDRLFLVTAAHVATSMSARASVTLGVENDAARTLTVPELIGSAGEPQWVVHPVADVAVLPLQPATDVKSLLVARALPPAVLVGKLEAPARDRPLTVIGFPLGLGVLVTGPGGKISPISRESKAASGLLTLPRADTKKPSEFFVLDSPGVGGFSGAPVFILAAAFSQGAGITFSATTLFVGLMHGTVSDETGGKFALIVPSAFVTQTLEKAYAVAERR